MTLITEPWEGINKQTNKQKFILISRNVSYKIWGLAKSHKATNSGHQITRRFRSPQVIAIAQTSPPNRATGSKTTASGAGPLEGSWDCQRGKWLLGGEGDRGSTDSFIDFLKNDSGRRRYPLEQGCHLGGLRWVFQGVHRLPVPQTPATTYTLGLHPPRPTHRTSQPLSHRRWRRPWLQTPRLTCRVIRDLIFCMSKSGERYLPQRTNKSLQTTGRLAPAEGSHSGWSREAAELSFRWACWEL